MNSLRNMSISRRLWLILIVAVLMLLALGLLMLKQIHDDLYQAKRQQTQHVVQTASGILTFYHGLETTGVMTREAAQKQALSAVRGLRYDHDDYFWIKYSSISSTQQSQGLEPCQTRISQPSATTV
jgi:methyl-accepting chemotaxis protein